MDAALEKIFHPEKFDVKQLTRDEQGHVDERSRRFSAGGASLDPRAQMFIGGSEAEDETENEEDAGFKKPRSVVQFDASTVPAEPASSSNVKKAHSQASFQTYMRAVSGKQLNYTFVITVIQCKYYRA